MKCDTIFNVKNVSLVVILFTFLTVCECGYLITTPRKWTSGESSQVCVSFLNKEKSADPSLDKISIEIKSVETESKEILKKKDISIFKEIGNHCTHIQFPISKYDRGTIFIYGSLEGKTLNYSKPISIAKDVAETYVQTDKYLYKPSQTVQFRILTVIGPKLKLSLDQYEEIWVENPSGTRIAQWLNVTNENGLIHMEFKLSEEPEEGTYKIKVRTPYKKTVVRTFKVEEYVLPRYKVTVKPPKYILGTSTTFDFKVCAKYTFGQPVKGNLTLTLDNGGWGNYKKTITKQAEISGCHTVTFNSTDIDLNTDSFFAHNLEATAIVVEAGTDVQLDSKKVAVDVTRTALSFEDISVQKYYKPELPFIGEVKVSFPGETPAVSEPISVCAGETECKNLTTNSNGILKFIVPPHNRGNIRVKALNYPHKPAVDSSWRTIMYESSFYKTLKQYHSPSNSSIVIALSDDKIQCKGEQMKFDVPVRFSVVKLDSALVNIEVISRGQIIFSLAENYQFSPNSDLHIDENLLLAPIREPVTKGSIRGTFIVPVELSPLASPLAKIVVWYARPDGEVVSDARKIDITDCLLNNVNFTWSDEKVQPGDPATMTLTAAPQSLCSLGVVDKSVQLLSSKNNDLTISKLLEVAEKASVSDYENLQVNDHEYCRSKKGENEEEDPVPTIGPPIALPIAALPVVVAPAEAPESRRKRSFRPFWPFYSDDIDALHMFDEAGVYAFSDLTLETRPCRQRPEFYEYADDIRFESEVSVLESVDLVREEASPDNSNRNFQDRTDSDQKVNTSNSTSEDTSKRTYFPETWLWNLFNISEYSDIGGRMPVGMPGMPGMPMPPPPMSMNIPSSLGQEDSRRTPKEKVPRSYFPETWLWKLVALTDTGSAEESVTLPDTITEWVGSAVCVHPTKGVGISESASITTFRDFFADLTLPPSVKRGETFPVKISVFNYLSEPLPLKVILEPSDQFDILSDEGTELGSGERTSCLKAEDKVVHSIRIRPKDIGDVNITVNAFVDANSLSTCGHGTGKLRTDILIKPIRVELEGFPKEKTWSKYICTSEIEANEDALEPWSIEAPPSIVEDSARAFVIAAGDLMGPTVENLGGLVKMPYGCGEQNMLNFAPNIFVMQYLDAAGENTPEIADNAINFMNKGYQRELNYRHKDGSFSAFGESDDSGSTWLTAFVVKSFAQAREYIQVDNQDLSMSKDWLKQRQLENGCFESVGKVLHKGMKGGIGSSESLSQLSSFVLIALMEAGENPADKATREALFCLKADNDTKNPYALAVKAYALSLAKSPDASSVLPALLSIATENSATIHWKLPESIESGKGVGVETAGYAVLALLTFDPVLYLVQARKIIKWMNNERNGQGGFVSTQDTIVALQAMGLYERTMTKEPVDLTVLVGMGAKDYQFEVKEQNKLLQQRVNIPALPTTVTLDVAGSGCVLVQAVLKYNVPEPDASEAFGVRVETSTSPDKACKTKRVKVCAKYLLPDLKSNMAIIEVNLMSGYIPDKTDLKKIVGYGTGLFKRYEVDGSIVHIYVDEFSPEEICASFRVIREVEVENPKPGSVKVYDYYKPEYFVTEKYELPPVTECKDEKDEILPFEGEIVVEAKEDTILTTLPPGEREALLGDFVDALDAAIPS